MALRKKVGPAGGPVAAQPLRPNVNRQVIQPPRPTNHPGHPALIAAGIEDKPKPKGHRPAGGTGR